MGLLGRKKRQPAGGSSLDPAAFVHDFDRTLGRLTEAGLSDRSSVLAWEKSELGDHPHLSGAAMAITWYSACLSDAPPRRWPRDPSARAGTIFRSGFYVEKSPDARKVVVQLGELLWDEGALAGPYDERSSPDNPDEPLERGDAGPTRLLALLTLAAYAHELGHPRAPEWISTAKAGIPVVPPSIFFQGIRDRWEALGGLPVEEQLPREISIWADRDVKEIYADDGIGRTLLTEQLDEADLALFDRYVQARPETAGAHAPQVATACLAGVTAFEGFSSGVSAGWRKLVLYGVSDLTYSLWENYQLTAEAAALAHWIVEAISANGWAKSGRNTALGQHSGYATLVADECGAPILYTNAATGRAEMRTGDRARRAAAAGNF